MAGRFKNNVCYCDVSYRSVAVYAQNLFAGVLKAVVAVWLVWHGVFSTSCTVGRKYRLHRRPNSTTALAGGMSTLHIRARISFKVLGIMTWIRGASCSQYRRTSQRALPSLAIPCPSISMRCIHPVRQTYDRHTGRLMLAVSTSVSTRFSEYGHAPSSTVCMHSEDCLMRPVCCVFRDARYRA